MDYATQIKLRELELGRPLTPEERRDHRDVIGDVGDDGRDFTVAERAWNMGFADGVERGFAEVSRLEFEVLRLREDLEKAERPKVATIKPPKTAKEFLRRRRLEVRRSDGAV